MAMIWLQFKECQIIGKRKLKKNSVLNELTN